MDLTKKIFLPRAWIFVPDLYFTEGLVYVLVNTVSVIVYKKMGLSNTLIGLTSFLYLPWTLKMLWGPLVDGTSTKRSWIIWMQYGIGILLLITAMAWFFPAYFALTLILFTLAAFFSGTHDIAVDGFYMISLNQKDQAFFIGIRSLFYRVSMLFATGFLVYLAGRIEIAKSNIRLSWAVVFVASGIIYLVFGLFNHFYLPRMENSSKTEAFPLFPERPAGFPFAEAFKTYFMQKGIVPIVLFIVFYRLGEALQGKMASPFFLDKTSDGGLGLATSQVGLVYGTAGLVSLMAGGILGGAIVARYGLKKWIWPFAFLMNLPNLFYVYLSLIKPAMVWVYILVCVDQFGYGMGITALKMVLLYAVTEKYKTSHFAISTGIMALGMMLPGMVSGLLQEALGYTRFFTVASVLALPGMAMIFFLPLKNFEASANNKNAGRP